MRQNRILHLLLIFSSLVLLFSGCADYGSQTLGTLEFRFLRSAQKAVYSPSIALDIASYQIVLDSGTETKTYALQTQTALVVEGLIPGLWSIAVTAYNGWDADTSQVSGQRVATLPKQADGTRSVQYNVKRGQVTTANLSLVPLNEGTGSLTLTIDWSQSSLILENPRLEIDIRGYNEHSGFYDDNSSYSQSLVVEDASDTYTTTLQNLVPGWYEIQTRLIAQNTEGDANLFYQSIDFARVAAEDTQGTIGTLPITDEMLATGTIDWVFTEDMEQALQGLALSRDTSDNVLYTGITQKFSCSYESPTASYQWYVDGIPVADADEKTFSHVFTEGGTSRVLVAVKDGSVINGAELTVEVLQGYEIGSTGQAGGVIFFCDTDDIYEWTYLEAAPEDLIDSPMPWSNIQNELVHGTLDAIGTGAANTAKIIDQEGHISSAALACTLYSNAGYEDWFLPSIEELKLLIENNEEIAQTEQLYWSSTEGSYRTAKVKSSLRSLSFNKGGSSNYDIYVRPIRSF